MKRIIFVLIAIVTCITLSGCAGEQEPESTPLPEIIDEIPLPEIPTAKPIANDRFTLRYSAKNSVNPITGTNPDNLLVASLMYEGLFALDSDFNAVPVLCDSFEASADFTEYTITIKQGIAMSDGADLTANDVAYTLNRAAVSGRYVSRLHGVISVTALDKQTVSIVLSEPNSRFIKLLDIPIIRYGYIDSAIPPGTGPYIMSEGNENLVRFSGHRDYASLPVGVVYLMECGSMELIELFSDGEISLITDDPGGAVEFYVSRRHETRYYNTTSFQFVGFNIRTPVLANTELRRAIGLAVDRTYIADTIMSGCAVAAPLALPAFYKLYDSAWEPAVNSIVEMSAILADIGLDDVNNDTHLEYPLESGDFISFNLDFIVNKENSLKVYAANKIADTLRRVGFNITVRELPWNAFLEALDTGDFDMYYGEVILTADLDLTGLLAPGGSFDFGGTGDESYPALVHDFLAAPGEMSEQTAAKALCQEILQNAPFLPVLYKKHAVHSVRGVVTGAVPTQSSVFFNLVDWTIKPGGTGTR